MRAAFRTAAVAAAAVLASGCGGSGSAKSYDPDAVSSCLRGKNFIVSPADADYIAQDNNGFYVHTSDTASTYGLGGRANVSFGNVSEIKQAYSAFGDGRMDTAGNALVVWDNYDAGSWKLIKECLR